MKKSKFLVQYNNDETRVYREVTIHRDRKVKTGEAGCYYVKEKLCTSIQDAQLYIDEMLEACGIEFFKTRTNPLLVDLDQTL